jgi:hypothetical protein
MLAAEFSSTFPTAIYESADIKSRQIAGRHLSDEQNFPLPGKPLAQHPTANTDSIVYAPARKALRRKTFRRPGPRCYTAFKKIESTLAQTNRRAN